MSASTIKKSLVQKEIKIKKIKFMNNKKWNYSKIIKEIKKNGYFVFKNYLDKKDIKEIKESLLETFNYIKKGKEKNLQKKYYEIKKFSPKLKGNWYDISNYNMTLRKFVHSPAMIELVKRYFKSKVIFSVRPCIHAHDHTNDFLLSPHQETYMMSADGILLWTPLYDTNKNNGGLVVYENSHKHGFFKHETKHPTLGKKAWTKEYTHISDSIIKKFKRLELDIKAGSAVFMLNSMMHCGYQMKKKGHVRITVTERFNPLQRIPFLKKENAPLKIPYEADYSKILF